MKTKYIDEMDAIKAITEFVKYADLDDLAAVYSRFCTDGSVIVTGDSLQKAGKAESEPYLDGDRNL